MTDFAKIAAVPKREADRSPIQSWFHALVATPTLTHRTASNTIKRLPCVRPDRKRHKNKAQQNASQFRNGIEVQELKYFLAHVDDDQQDEQHGRRTSGTEQVLSIVYLDEIFV